MLVSSNDIRDVAFRVLRLPLLPKFNLRALAGEVLNLILPPSRLLSLSLP